MASRLCHPDASPARARPPISNGRRCIHVEALHSPRRGVSAQILYWQIQETYPGAEVVFVEDVTDIAEVTVEDGNVIHVVKDWDFTHLESGDWTNQGGCEGFLVGSDNPKLKKVLVEKALAHGLRPAPTLIHPRAYVASYGCTIGRGGMIMPGLRYRYQCSPRRLCLLYREFDDRSPRHRG